MVDPMTLPADLPRPEDDGAAAHLPGTAMPDLALASTAGGEVTLGDLGADGRAVVFAYPWTGRPGEPLLTEEWDTIPGARGCTPETCGFRDLHAEFEGAGANVLGLSTQGTGYQQELAERLGLPFPILSDERLELIRALRLPSMEAGGMTLIKRLTLIISAGKIEHVFYPVFPPDRHAAHVLAWLRMKEEPVSR